MVVQKKYFKVEIKSDLLKETCKQIVIKKIQGFLQRNKNSY